jgi:hypothetical protein
VIRARAHPWYDRAWPLVSGALTGAGLLAAYRWTGAFAFVVAVLVLGLALVPVIWALLEELGYGDRRTVSRLSPGCVAVVLGVIGLAHAIGGWWTCLVVGLTLLTSPLVRGWSDGGLQGVVARWATPRTRVRREFDAIVSLSFGADQS